MINLLEYYQGSGENYTTEEIAQALLGSVLVNETPEGLTSGIIVETEAYLGLEDEAAHSYNGRNTPRIQAMFGKPGTLYVHQMHRHILVNIVTQPKGVPQGVLIRALEPLEGLELMTERRKKTGHELSNGPAKLSQAMGISMDYNLEHILDSRLSIEPNKRVIPIKIQSSPRIGIKNKGKWTDAALRFYVKGNPFVSRFKGEISETFGWKSCRL